MNLHFSRNQLLFFVLSLLVMAVISIIVYFTLFQPAELQHTQVQQDLKAEQLLLAKSTQQSQAGTSNETTGISDVVQQQLPVQPLVDEYMVDLEKAEGISGVTIRNITLQDAAKTNGQSNTNMNNGGSSSTTGTAQTTTGTAGAANTPSTAGTTKNANVPVPITLNVEVQYNVYEELQSFLKQLEGMQRITYVQKFDFQGRDEITTPNMKQVPYHSVLVLTIYYMPSMKELEKGTPTIQLPPLCENRSNPIEPQKCK